VHFSPERHVSVLPCKVRAGVILRAGRGHGATLHRRLTFVKPFGPYAERDINASRREVDPAESGDNVAVNA
jgi:hypothetical protein